MQNSHRLGQKRCLICGGLDCVFKYPKKKKVALRAYNSITLFEVLTYVYFHTMKKKNYTVEQRKNTNENLKKKVIYIMNL